MTLRSKAPTSTSQPSARDTLAPDELLWEQTHANLEAFDEIVTRHFHRAIRERKPMQEGSYARAFLYTLEDDFQVVGRISLRVRERIKTEAEVAAMRLIKFRTSIPSPSLYLYCSSAFNPVGAEWLLMQYLPGARLCDCFDQLDYPQKYRLAADLVNVMASLFNITSSHLGCIMPENGPDPLEYAYSSRSPASLRDPEEWSATAVPRVTQIERSLDGRFLVGPLNDITFLDYPKQIPPEQSGPFSSEREFLEAFAYRGLPGTRSSRKLSRWAFEKLLEVYDAIRPLYRGFRAFSNPDSAYHFAHGDLSSANILVDTATGAITGVVDWEMAGFRPAWLSSVAAGWFDDDAERFLMTDDQSHPRRYKTDTKEDTRLRAYFRAQLAKRDEGLFRHHWLGVEFRAMFYAASNEYAGNAEVWLEKYEEQEWNVSRRGHFPFDFKTWVEERCILEETEYRNAQTLNAAE